jgi:hypothetical protein
VHDHEACSSPAATNGRASGQHFDFKLAINMLSSSDNRLVFDIHFYSCILYQNGHSFKDALSSASR